MRKLCVCFLCLLLTASLSGTAEQNEAAIPLLGNGGFFPLQTPVTLTAWVVNALDDTSVKDSQVLDWIAEKTNVRLEITREFQGTDGKRQLNFHIETEEQLPDILLCTRWTKAECALYGMRGLVQPLDDYLKACENWNRLNDICGMEHKNDLIMSDGHIYCYGNVNECFHLTHQARMWVYQPWIDALMDGRLPRTTEEFREYLQAVATQDPNGNGIADEIPLTGQISEGWASDPITFLSNAFVQNNTIFGSTNPTVASGCYVRNGRAHCNWVEDGYKEALRYLRSLYREGLLHSQVFTQNARQLSARVNAQPHLAGAVAGGYFPAVSREQLPSSAWSEWTCLPPLEGPDGTRFCYQSAYDYFYNCNGLLTRDCRSPEIAVQLFDFLAGSEGTLVQNYGREGVDWVWCAPGEGQGINGAPALYRYLPENQDLPREKSQTWPSDVQICSNFDAFRRGAQVQPGIMNGEDELWKCAEMYDAYSPGRASVYPNAVSSPEDSKKLVTYQTAIEDYVRQSAIYFITDCMSLENDWNAYLSMLDILGQQNYEQLLQQALNEYLSK